MGNYTITDLNELMKRPGLEVAIYCAPWNDLKWNVNIEQKTEQVSVRVKADGHATLESAVADAVGKYFAAVGNVKQMIGEDK